MMTICSKCKRECFAITESRSANPIYSDSIAVSNCCHAEIIPIDDKALTEQWENTVSNIDSDIGRRVASNLENIALIREAEEKERNACTPLGVWNDTNELRGTEEFVRLDLSRVEVYDHYLSKWRVSKVKSHEALLQLVGNENFRYRYRND